MCLNLFQKKSRLCLNCNLNWYMKILLLCNISLYIPPHISSSCLLSPKLQVNTSTSTVILKSDGNEVHWEPGKPLLPTLESMGIVKEVFPVHGMFSDMFKLTVV